MAITIRDVTFVDDEIRLVVSHVQGWMGPGESQEQPWQVERDDGDGQRRLVSE